MYIPKERHQKVFKNVYPVLKDRGEFLLWDVKMPARRKNFRVFVVRLKIQLPNEKIETGYGTVWDKTQNIEHFKQLALKTGFKIMKEWSKGKILFLEMKKEGMVSARTRL